MEHTGDNMNRVRRNNRSAVLRLLHEHQNLSRKRLAEQTLLTPAAITKITGELIAEGLVHTGDALSTGRAGRREIGLSPNPRSRCALGLLLNRGQAVLSAAWLDGSVIFTESCPLPVPAPAEETLARLCARLNALCREHALSPDAILGVGVAVRGVPAEDGRRVRNSFGALEGRDLPLCALVESLTGLPAILENNVRALLAAQLFLSAGEQKRSQFFLRCEYGIGGALAVNGQVWSGASRQCSEIGHIPVVREGGKRCVCGRCGCLETLASPAALREDAAALLSPEATPLLWRLHAAHPESPLSLEEIFDAAEGGDAPIAALADRAAAALADALKAVLCTINPEDIVLYGSLFDHPWFLRRLKEQMARGEEEGRLVFPVLSPYNHRLEQVAAPLLMVEDFLASGGFARALG